MNPDFVDFLTALIAADARFIVVGAPTRILAISKHSEKIHTRRNVRTGARRATLLTR